MQIEARAPRREWLLPARLLHLRACDDQRCLRLRWRSGHRLLPGGRVGRCGCGFVEHRPPSQLFRQRALRAAVRQGQEVPVGPGGPARRHCSAAGQVNTIFVAQSGYPLGMSMASSQSGTAFGNRPEPGLRRQARRTDSRKLLRHQLLHCAGSRRPWGRRAHDAVRTWALEHRPVDVEEDSTGCSSAPRSSTCSTTRNSPFRARRSARPTFGVIQSTVKSSRQIQFALKYVF